MEMIRDEGAKVLEIPLVKRGTSGGSAPERFYQRFASDGRVLDPHWPRVTSEDSEPLFARRKDGLRLLLINAPIRGRTRTSCRSGTPTSAPSPPWTATPWRCST